MKTHLVLLTCALSIATVSSATPPFADNTASFSVPPTTQAVGSVTNNLKVAPVLDGLVVFGNWSVTLGPGPQSGTLLEFEAARLMQPFGYGPFVYTSMSVPGIDYIDRPVGHGSTSGSGTMEIDGQSNSLVGWTFPNNGSGKYFYNNGFGYVSQSGPLTYVGGSNRYMRMKYTVDFDYDGQARSEGSPPDVGADKLMESPDTDPPARPENLRVIK